MQKVEIRVKGRLKERWSEWFGGLTISHSEPGETILCGMLADQAALYGVISRLRDLGLELVSVQSEATEPDGFEDAFERSG